MADVVNVFVYGTLRYGEPNSWLLGNALDRRNAIAPGLALGVPGHRGFPYAIERDSSHIVGELVTIAATETTRVLQQLDHLEGFVAEDPQHSHYVRRKRQVLLPDHHCQEAWIYLAGPRISVTQLELIASGDWIQQ